MSALEPGPGLIVKLGSALVHAEEALETGNTFDVTALNSILSDPEVQAWREEMDAMGLLPVKRDS